MTALGYYRYKCSPRPEDNILLPEEEENNGEGDGEGGTSQGSTEGQDTGQTGSAENSNEDGSFDPENSRDN